MEYFSRPFPLSMRVVRLSFRFLALLLKHPSWFLKNLYNYTNDAGSKDHVTRVHGMEHGLPTVDLLELLPSLNDTIDHYSFLDGTSRPTDLLLLRGLAKKLNAKRYVEFGTWRGESLANVAPLVEEAVAITFSQAEMRAQGFPEGAVRAARCFSSGLPNVRVHEHNTQTFDFTALVGQCDLVFIDADHEWKGVSIDTANAFTLLRDDRSIIVWHDYGKDYETVNWQVLRGILDGAPSDEHRKRIHHVSNTLCAVYIPEQVHSSRVEKYVPNKAFSMNVEARSFEVKT